MKKMSTLLSMVVLSMILLAGCGSKTSEGLKDGSYIGESAGLKGLIQVEVEVKDGKIADVIILDNNETETIFESIEEYLIPDIIKNNSADVETVSGATTSSAAVLEAVKSALKQAE